MKNSSLDKTKPGAIGFDFDGVFVLNSDGLFKQEAWAKIFDAHSGAWQLLEEAKALYGNGKKGGRTEIIRHVFQKLGFSSTELEDLVSHACDEFDQYVQGRILEEGSVSGASEMLQSLHEQDIPLYLNSSTATEALVRSAQNLGIDHFFREILGSTKAPIGGSKVENLLYIAEKEGIDYTTLLVVGDGDSDLNAAEQVGCRFLGVANHWNNWASIGVTFPYVTELGDVPQHI